MSSAPASLQLVLDTSGMGIDVGLARGGDLVATLRHRPMGHISEQLRPDVERLLASEGLDWSAIETVAAVRGPGSFTGLRVGLAFALGLAAARKIPSTGVPTLDALAEGLAAAGVATPRLLVAFRSGSIRGDWYARPFRCEAGGAVPLGDAAVLDPAPFSEAMRDATALAGDFPTGGDERLPALVLPGREALLAGAARRAAKALAVDGSTEPLSPLYLLEPDAVRRREAALAGGRR